MKSSFSETIQIAFDRFEEEGHEEWRHDNFNLIDLTRKDLYIMGVPAIFDDDDDDDDDNDEPEGIIFHDYSAYEKGETTFSLFALTMSQQALQQKQLEPMYVQQQIQKLCQKS